MHILSTLRGVSGFKQEHIKEGGKSGGAVWGILERRE